MADMDLAEARFRSDCWNKALESYGTSWIFERRANRLRAQTRSLTFLGIIGPLLLGAIALEFGNVALFPGLLIPAGIIAIVQVVGSLWSLVARWEDSYSYALESMNSNSRLSDEFRDLASNPEAIADQARLKYQILEQEDRLRCSEDTKQGVTEKEKRMGMRSALRQFKRPCAGCGKVPVSMEPTDCPVCGQF